MKKVQTSIKYHGDTFKPLKIWPGVPLVRCVFDEDGLWQPQKEGIHRRLCNLALPSESWPQRGHNLGPSIYLSRDSERQNFWHKMILWPLMQYYSNSKEEGTI